MMKWLPRAKKYVWHGSLVSGERAMELYCDAWDSDSSERLGLASPLLPTHQLLGQQRFPCDQAFAVLCIEVTSQSRGRRRRDVTELSEHDYHRLLSELTRDHD